MSESLDVAADSAADLIQEDQLERVREFTREPIVLEGETIADLVPGTARRRAVDAAIIELDDGPRDAFARVAPEVLAPARAGAPALRRSPFTLAKAPSSPSTRSTCSRGRSPRSTTELEESDHDDRSNGARAARSNSNGAEAADGDAAGNGSIEAIEDEDEDEVVPEEEEPLDWEEPAEEELVEEAPEDPGADRRFWFEHATGSGKTVAALGFIEGSRTGGVLILTHRRNLVDQFIGEISDRGYKDRLSPPLLGTDRPPLRPGHRRDVPVVRPQRRAKISDAYAIVICDEAHTALGEKTSACIRAWPGPFRSG